MNFTAKLNQAISEMDRRDFLKKTTRGAVSASTGGLDKLAGIAGKVARSAPAAPVASKELVASALECLFSAGLYHRGHDENGPIPLEKIAKGVSPEQITAYLESEYLNKDSKDIAGLACYADGEQYLDEYTGGAFTRTLEKFIKKYSPTELAKSVIYWGGIQRDGRVEGLTQDTAYITLGGIASKIPSFGRVFPAQIFYDAINKDVTPALNLLLRRGAITKDVVDREVAEQIKNIKRHERYEIERNTEIYTPGPDHEIYGSAMHQPFESRLNKVFKLV